MFNRIIEQLDYTSKDIDKHIKDHRVPFDIPVSSGHTIFPVQELDDEWRKEEESLLHEKRYERYLTRSVVDGNAMKRRLSSSGKQHSVLLGAYIHLRDSSSLPAGSKLEFILYNTGVNEAYKNFHVDLSVNEFQTITNSATQFEDTFNSSLKISKENRNTSCSSCTLYKDDTDKKQSLFSIGDIKWRIHETKLDCGLILNLLSSSEFNSLHSLRARVDDPLTESRGLFEPYLFEHSRGFDISIRLSVPVDVAEYIDETAKISLRFDLHLLTFT